MAAKNGVIAKSELEKKSKAPVDEDVIDQGLDEEEDEESDEYDVEEDEQEEDAGRLAVNADEDEEEEEEEEEDEEGENERQESLTAYLLADDARPGQEGEEEEDDEDEYIEDAEVPPPTKGSKRPLEDTDENGDVEGDEAESQAKKVKV